MDPNSYSRLGAFHLRTFFRCPITKHQCFLLICYVICNVLCVSFRTQRNNVCKIKSLLNNFFSGKLYPFLLRFDNLPTLHFEACRWTSDLPVTALLTKHPLLLSVMRKGNIRHIAKQAHGSRLNVLCQIFMKRIKTGRVRQDSRPRICPRRVVRLGPSSQSTFSFLAYLCTRWLSAGGPSLQFTLMPETLLAKETREIPRPEQH